MSRAGPGARAVSLAAMTLVERITQDLTAAMKAQDAARTSTLRMAKAALKNKEIDKKAPLDDAEALKIVQGLVKQREDSVEQYVKANRPELADKERAEIALLKAYLPADVSRRRGRGGGREGRGRDRRRVGEGHGQGDEGGARRARRERKGRRRQARERGRRGSASSVRDVVRRVGQRFAIGFEGHTASADAKALLREFGVGSVILFGRNVAAPEQVADLVRELQETARAAGHELPLLVVRGPGGRARRADARPVDGVARRARRGPHGQRGDGVRGGEGASPRS